MKSAPIRLTKYESGVLLNYIDNRIFDITMQIDCAYEAKISQEEVESLHLDEMMLTALKLKLKNCYEKCSYQMPYTRKKGEK